MPRRLLLDTGGTFIKGAVVGTAPYDAILLSEFQLPSSSGGTAQEIAASLQAAWARGGRVDEVAVSIPGPFDYRNGIFRMQHKFAAVNGRSYRELMGVPEDVPVAFMHDVHAQLLGEMRSGAAQACDNVALVTLGTGLGFIVATGGQIRLAPSGSPADSIWNLPCRDGILEDYVSSRGIRRLYGREIAVREIADLAHAGEPAARAAFDQAGRLLAEALRPVLETFGVQRLLLGGQIARSFDLLAPALAELRQDCPALDAVLPVSDVSRAAFRGLAAQQLP